MVTVDSEPAIWRSINRIAQRIKLELDLDSSDGHKTHGSSQKRHTDNPDQGSREEKKQKQGRGTRNTGGGGGGGKKNGGVNGGGSGGKQPPDGHRFPDPPPHSAPQFFACPFHKFDPVRYDCCSSVRLTRLCDVSQHIWRCHRLRDVKQKTANAKHADNAGSTDNVELVGSAEAEEKVAVYCPKCRMEFFGTTAEANLRQHLPCQTPQPATSEQTGVLLPKEFEGLVEARKKATGDIPKWYAMWNACLPNKPPPKSPYFALPGQEAVVETSTVVPEVEVETLVPRSQGEEIIRQALQDCPSHFFFPEDEIDAIVNHALNGLYPGSSGAEPQTSTDTRLEVPQRQMPERQMFQQQISQQPFNGAVAPTVFDPSVFPAAPQAYPPSHQLYQHPSAPAPFAPTPRVVPPPAPQTNTQTQEPSNYYGAPFVNTPAFALPTQHSTQMSPPAANFETGPPMPFRSAHGPVASETSPASQANGTSFYDVNDGGFDGRGFPAPSQSGADVSSFSFLEGNGVPTNNGSSDGFSWWGNNGYQD